MLVLPTLGRSGGSAAPRPALGVVGGLGVATGRSAEHPRGSGPGGGSEPRTLAPPGLAQGAQVTSGFGCHTPHQDLGVLRRPGGVPPPSFATLGGWSLVPRLPPFPWHGRALVARGGRSPPHVWHRSVPPTPSVRDLVVAGRSLFIVVRCPRDFGCFRPPLCSSPVGRDFRLGSRWRADFGPSPPPGRAQRGRDCLGPGGAPTSYR